MMRPVLEIDMAPTRVYFGWGAFDRLADLVAEMGRNVLVVTGRSYSGQADRINALVSRLKQHGVSTVVRNQIRPNPDVEEIRELLPATCGVDVVVGIGGGSVIDASKALAVAAAADDQRVMDLWVSGTPVEPGTPRCKLVVVPSTAGTGSELSFGAILSDRTRGWKGGIRGAGLAPELAVVDPELTVTLSSQLTSETGFDVITHAFESYVSKRADARSRVLSLTAISNVATNLPRVIAEPTDRTSRTSIAFSSMIMGLNLREVGTCLPHRLQYPIGGEVPDVSHPEALAWIYPPWISRLYYVRKAEVSDFLEILGMGRPSSGEDAGVRMRQWLERINLATRPPDSVRLDPSALVSKIEGNLSADPIPDPERAALDIYKELW